MEYETAKVAVNPVILSIIGDNLVVLLNPREKAPYKGRYELPGGLLLRGEDPEVALKRKLQALIGGTDVYFVQFKTFADPRRDPRWRTVSIGYVALVQQDMINDRKGWFGMSELPATAFDHSQIIGDARTFLKRNISEVIAKQFLPKLFPINSLQRVYETIEEKKYDNRNFRKKMVYDGIVEETEKLLENCSYRPPRLYRFVKRR